MKTLTWLILAFLILLMAGSVALPRTASAVERTSSGGGYHLTALTWQVTGEARAGGYTLRSPQSPSLESGCCCVYLPCVKK
jgi:hypothetical protein